MAIYDQKQSGFDNGRKMRFFPNSDLVKYDMARGSITKACER